MSATEIGRRLKKARLDAGLTQEKVAKMLGITYQAISNYERGINRVESDTLVKLCTIYHIKVGDLLQTPAWTKDMIAAYHAAESDEKKQFYIDLWGTPMELLEAENNRREPDLSPLSAEDEALLYTYHYATPEDRAIIDNIIRRYIPAVSDTKILKIAANTGKSAKKRITGQQSEDLQAFLDGLPNADDEGL